MRTKNTDLKDVWQTPDEITGLLDSIDLDPCAASDTSIGDTNYTEVDDGLAQDWFGRVFVNPPFSEKEDWLEKAVSERENTDVIFVVTPDSTDTKSWWHTYIAPYADYIWFSCGRIGYVNPDTGEQMPSPTFGTAISIFGEPTDTELGNLADNGQLLQTYHP